MAISFDTSWTVHEQLASATNSTASHSPGVNAKLMVVAAIGTQTISNITDNQSNSYTLIQLGNIAGTRFVAAAYCVNPIIAATFHTVTLSASGGSNIAAVTINGTATSSPFDKQAVANGTSNAPNSGNTANTTFPNEVLIGIGGCGLTATTWGAGVSYTLDQSIGTGNSPGLAIEHRIVAAQGTYPADFTCTNTPSWLSAILTFSDTPVPPPTVDAGATWIGQIGPALAAPFNLNQFAPFGYSTQPGLPLPPQGGGTGKYRRRFHRYT